MHKSMCGESEGPQRQYLPHIPHNIIMSLDFCRLERGTWHHIVFGNKKFFLFLFLMFQTKYLVSLLFSILFLLLRKYLTFLVSKSLIIWHQIQAFSETPLTTTSHTKTSNHMNVQRSMLVHKVQVNYSSKVWHTYILQFCEISMFWEEIDQKV